MKFLKKYTNIEILHYCQTVFGWELPSVKSYEKFIKKFACASRTKYAKLKTNVARHYR